MSEEWGNEPEVGAAGDTWGDAPDDAAAPDWGDNIADEAEADMADIFVESGTQPMFRSRTSL